MVDVNVMELKTISIVISTYNEENFIADCLDSSTNSDFPEERLEIFVVDGGSTDRTYEIVNKYAQKYSYIKLLDNPNRYTPFVFYIGIRNSTKEIIMGAHEVYPENYTPKCVHYFNELKTDNICGAF